MRLRAVFTATALAVLILLCIGLFWLVVNTGAARPPEAPTTSVQASPRKMPGRLETRLAGPGARPVRTSARVDSSIEPASSTSGAQAEAIRIAGDTPFQRRLSAGEEFRELDREFDVVCSERLGVDRPVSLVHLGTKVDALSEEDARELSDALAPLSRKIRELLPHILRIEKHRVFRENSLPFFDPDRWAVFEVGASVKTATQYPVDLHTLRLSPRSAASDPLGSDLLVRVWSNPKTFAGPALITPEIYRAEKLLRQIFDVTGVSSKVGFDVLLSPGLGEEVFPRESVTPWAVGLYFAADEFCIVNGRREPDARGETLEHELIHAYTYQYFPGMCRSPFVSEGLADFLPYLEPGDVGLDVPAKRLRHDFARLAIYLGWNRHRGILDRLNPARIARLSRSDFYQDPFYRFGYLIARLTMAYIGREPIEEAFRAKSDLPILEAVDRMDWSDFVSFVRANAIGGDPDLSRTVPDPPEERARGEPGPRRLGEILRDLGAPSSADDDLDELFDYLPRRVRSDGVSLQAAMRVLLDRSKPPLVLTDLSRDMKQPLSTRSRQIRLDWLKDLLRNFRRKDGDTPDIVRLSRKPTLVPAITAAEDTPYTAVMLPYWFRTGGRKVERAVICVASRDRVARELLAAETGVEADGITETELAESYRELFEKGSAPPAVLVVDLAPTGSDAQALARALVAYQQDRGQVVYWAPAAEPREE